MSKVISEETKVYGELYTDAGVYYMLQEFPTKTNIPWWLKDFQVLNFYVVDQRDNFAKNILVAGSNWSLVPFIEDKLVDVNFLIEDTQDVQS